MRPRLLAFLVLVLLASLAEAAPSGEPWARWARHDAAATATIDHDALDRLLGRYVRRGPDAIARFDYAGVTPTERAVLDAYIRSLEAVPISAYARPEQLAFWINLANALTIRRVLEHYPVKSIRDIAPKGAKLATVEGEALSLDDIEHRILRPISKDPRVHYALATAALGGPDLQPKAWRAAMLDERLSAAAIAFVNHPRGARLEGGRLRVSSLYEWNQADFGGSQAGVLRHLLAYAAPGLAMRLQERDRIDDYGYDWGLNDTR